MSPDNVPVRHFLLPKEPRSERHFALGAAHSFAPETDTEMSLEFAHMPDHERALSELPPVTSRADEERGAEWIKGFIESARSNFRRGEQTGDAAGYRRGYVSGFAWGVLCGALPAVIVTFAVCMTWPPAIALMVSP